MKSSQLFGDSLKMPDARIDIRKRIPTPALFKRIGGVTALREINDSFFNKVTGDDQLYPFFYGVSLAKIRLHQFKFVKIALSETHLDPTTYDSILKSHQRLFVDMDLTEKHFDRFVMHLLVSLKEKKCSSRVVSDTLSLVAPLRRLFQEAEKTAPQTNPTEEICTISPL